MRRSAGPPTLPVDPAPVPASARVERGPRGLRLASAGEPAGTPLAGRPGPALRLHAAVPVAARTAVVVAAGRLVLAAAPGVALSIVAPDMRVLHDRRPPGVDAIDGAPGANAGLIHADGGWRAVVLPSLGDLMDDLGEGPVALRGDGRRVAAAVDGAVVEADLGDEGPAARHEGGAAALCYTADGALLAARGGAVTPPGGPPGEGAPILALAPASGAPRVAAAHADGTVSVWDVESPEGPIVLARWSAPGGDATEIGLSADGGEVAIGASGAERPVAWMLRASDGAATLVVEGARALAPSPAADGIAVAGDWGCAWLRPVEEDE